MIDETPDASICRTCGFVAMGDPTQHCPICGAWPETFQRFLPVYWLNDLEPLAAIERLRQTPQQVAAAHRRRARVLRRASSQRPALGRCAPQCHTRAMPRAF